MKTDRRYTEGLLARLVRTVTPPPPAVRWTLEQGSTTYGRAWRVTSASATGALYRTIATGQTERELQEALAHYLDGYSDGRRDAETGTPEPEYDEAEADRRLDAALAAQAKERETGDDVTPAPRPTA